MGRLFETIQRAAKEDRFIISWHAEERCEEREVTVWQMVAGLEEAVLVRERPSSKPHPLIVVREELPDGTEVEAIWAWMAESRRAKLVTVFFRE